MFYASTHAPVYMFHSSVWFSHQPINSDPTHTRRILEIKTAYNYKSEQWISDHTCMYIVVAPQIELCLAIGTSCLSGRREY